MQQISSLAEKFQQHFQDVKAVEKEIKLFYSSFSLDPDDAPDHLQLKLIELQCDRKCYSWHQQLPLVNFYHQLDKDRFIGFFEHLKENAELVWLDILV